MDVFTFYFPFFPFSLLLWIGSIGFFEPIHLHFFLSSSTLVTSARPTLPLTPIYVKPVACLKTLAFCYPTAICCHFNVTTLRYIASHSSSFIFAHSSNAKLGNCRTVPIRTSDRSKRTLYAQAADTLPMSTTTVNYFTFAFRKNFRTVKRYDFKSIDRCHNLISTHYFTN